VRKRTAGFLLHSMSERPRIRVAKVDSSWPETPYLPHDSSKGKVWPIRARPDERHLPSDHVEELGQIIEMSRAQQAAQSCALVGGYRPISIWVLGGYSPELRNLHQAACASDPYRPEKYGPPAA
jgi:hypothetical protein